MSPLDLSYGFVEPPQIGKELCIPVMRRGVPWIQIDRVLQGAFGGRPIPVVACQDVSERRVGLTQQAVDLNRPPGCGFGLRAGFSRWKLTEIHLAG